MNVEAVRSSPWIHAADLPVRPNGGEAVAELRFHYRPKSREAVKAPKRIRAIFRDTRDPRHPHDARDTTGTCLALVVAVVCAGAAAFVPVSRGETQPIAHLDASADVVWVTENVPGGAGLEDPPWYQFRSHRDPRRRRRPTHRRLPSGPGRRVREGWGADIHVRGSIEVSPLGVTLTASDGQITSHYFLKDGGEPGNAPTGPVGKSGYAPTADYIEDTYHSGSVYVRGWVQSGYIRLTYVTPDTTPPVTSIACNGAACSGGIAGPASVSLLATDGGGSGVAATRYTTDGSDPTASSPLYTYPFSVFVTTTVKFRSWDNSNNVEATKTQTIMLRCSLDWLSSDAPYGNVTLVTNVTAADELVLTATVGSAQADPAPADNTLVLKANTPTATPPTPPPTLQPVVMKPVLGAAAAAAAGRRQTVHLHPPRHPQRHGLAADGGQDGLRPVRRR